MISFSCPLLNYFVQYTCCLYSDHPCETLFSWQLFIWKFLGSLRQLHKQIFTLPINLPVWEDLPMREELNSRFFSSCHSNINIEPYFGQCLRTERRDQCPAAFSAFLPWTYLKLVKLCITYAIGKLYLLHDSEISLFVY